MVQEKTLKRLDLDTLILEPARIQLPDGETITLRDFSTEEGLQFAQTISQPPAALAQERMPLHIANAVASLAPDAPGVRRLLDQVPVLHIFGLARWVQTMTPPSYTVPAPEPLAEVTFGGRTRELYPLRLGTYAAALELGAQAAEMQSDGRALQQKGAEVLASALSDTTVAEIMALDNRKRIALDALLQEATEAALADLQAGPLLAQPATTPTASPTVSRKSRASTAGRTRK